MKSVKNRLGRPAFWIMAGLMVLAHCAIFAACASVPQMEREFLSDPIMQRQDDAMESGMESHNFPRREGSVGGSSGSGGGCGC